IQWTPSALGVYPVTIQARDPQGGVARQTYSVRVREPNQAPMITSTPPARVEAGKPYRYEVQAKDANLPDDLLSYSLIRSPAGMLIDRSTGVVEWQTDKSQLGTSQDVTLQVRDQD